jgi:serine/threonine protein kinase
MKHLLAGRYLFEAPVGHGPVGTVWRARDEGTGEVLAVKVLDEPYAGPHAQDRFERERYTLTTFLHTAHVRVRDVVTDDGGVALVMELVDGVDVHRRTTEEGPLPTDLAIAIARTLAEALAASHEAGIVHAGIKPTNVLIDSTGQARLTDSRVARLASSSDGAGVLMNDPAFLSPETADGAPPLPAADIYALGQLLMVMVTGAPLAPGRSADDLPALVPENLRPILTVCLAPDPVARPTAEQLATMLRDGAIEMALGPSQDDTATHARRARPVARRRPGRKSTKTRNRTRLMVASRTAPASATATETPPTQDRTLIGWPLLVVLGLTAIIAAVTVYAVIGLNEEPYSHGSNQADGSPRQSTSPAGQPTVNKPVLPAIAASESVEGGTAYVKYWLEALNYAITTGDTGPVEAAGMSDCLACTAAVRTVQDGYRGSSTLRGGTYQVRQVTTEWSWTNNNPRFTVVFDRTARSSVRADGTVIPVLPPVNRATGEFVLIRIGDRWLMRRVASNTPVV